MAVLNELKICTHGDQIIMFNFIDKKLQKIFEKILHKRKKHYIHKAIEVFIKSHPYADLHTINKLKEQLENEADRVYKMIDKSVLQAGIKRAKFTFWLTLILSLVLIGTLSILTYGFTLALFVPAITASIAWLVTLATIPVSYNERIKGGLDTVLFSFEKEFNNQSDVLHHLEQTEENIQHLSLKLASLVKKFSQGASENSNDELEKRISAFLLSQSKEPPLHEVSLLWQSTLLTPIPKQTIHEAMQDETAARSLTVLNNRIDNLNSKVDDIYKILEKKKVDHHKKNCLFHFTLPHLHRHHKIDNLTEPEPLSHKMTF